MIVGLDWHNEGSLEEDVQYLFSLQPTMCQFMLYSPCPQTPLAKVVSYTAPLVSGVYLYVRLGTGLKVAAGERWLTALSLWAGLGLLVSALRAWSAREPRHLVDMAAPYGAALCLLAVSLGLPAKWLLLVVASAVLNVCALTIGWTQCQYLDITDPRSYWRVAPTGLALLSLAGFPLTLGFPAHAAIYSQVFAEGRWLVLLLLLAGSAGMLGALLRVLLDVECVVDEEFGGEDGLEPSRLGAGALDAVNIAFIGKIENDLRSFRLRVDQRVVALARLTKQRPGDGIQQGGFTGAIGAGDARQVETCKIQINRIAIG